MSAKLRRDRGADIVTWTIAGIRSEEPATESPSVEVAVEEPVDPSLAEARHQEELAAERASAFQRGLVQGREEEAQRNRELVQREVVALAAVARELGAYRPKLRRDAEADLVRLSLSIAKRVLHREIHVDPDAVLGLVRVALGKMAVADVLRIHVAPHHAAAVREELSRSGAPAQVEICSSADQPVGTVSIETTRGQAEVSVQNQIEEIERGFADLLEG